jgi:hypothetical protein
LIAPGVQPDHDLLREVVQIGRPSQAAAAYATDRVYLREYACVELLLVHLLVLPVRL